MHPTCKNNPFILDRKKLKIRSKKDREECISRPLLDATFPSEPSHYLPDIKFGFENCLKNDMPVLGLAGCHWRGVPLCITRSTQWTAGSSQMNYMHIWTVPTTIKRKVAIPASMAFAWVPMTCARMWCLSVSRALQKKERKLPRHTATNPRNSRERWVPRTSGSCTTRRQSTGWKSKKGQLFHLTYTNY